jgi:hypothetical protein
MDSETARVPLMVMLLKVTSASFSGVGKEVEDAVEGIINKIDLIIQ